MNPQTLISMILITMALVFYSIGVWSERISGRLKGWHLIFFWGGLTFDTTGTGMMMEMASGITFDIHALTGVVAIVLMGIHALWATVVLLRKDEQAILNFHKLDDPLYQRHFHQYGLKKSSERKSLAFSCHNYFGVYFSHKDTKRRRNNTNLATLRLGDLVMTCCHTT